MESHMSSTAPSTFESALLDAITSKLTGAVEGRQDKKKWTFLFDRGALVGSKSNLKSEQPDAVLAQKPDMAADAVAKNVLLRRLKGAITGASEWSAQAGAAPASPEPLDLLPLLIKAVATSREPEALRAALGADGALALGALTGLGLPAAQVGWLSGLGGQRLHAAAAEGPVEERERLALLGCLRAIGALQVEAPPAKAAAPAGLDLGALLGGPAAAPAAPPAAPAPAGPAAGLDLGALLGDLGATKAAHAAPAAPAANPWAPDKVVVPQGGAPAPAPLDLPPEDYEEAEIEALGDGGPVKLDAGFFASLNVRPDREVVAGAAAPTAAPPAPAHPLAAELQATHARLMAAANHFEVLGLPHDVAVEDFRKAHLALAQKLHPDRHNDAPADQQELASEAFDKVRAAWEVLGDDTKRKDYIDRVIFGKKTEEELAMEQVQNYWAAESDFKRGMAAFNAGRMPEAHKLFESAVAKVPEELEFRAYFGFTTFQTFRTRDPEKAEEGKDMIKEVVEKNKEQQRKLDGAWVLLGRIYRESNNPEAAFKCFRQALKLNPSNADAPRELKRLQGGQPGQPAQKKEEEKPGFFARLFGKK